MKIVNQLGRKFKQCDLKNDRYISKNQFYAMKNFIIAWFTSWLQFKTIDYRKKG